MSEQCLARQANGLCDRFFGQGTTPFFNDGFPGHAARDLLQHIRNQNAGASKSRLAVTDSGVNSNVTA